MFASCIAGPAYQLLTARAAAGIDRPLALWAGGSPAPGSSWSREVNARPWNADWAVLVSAAGGWGDPREVFPIVLGYARIDRVHRAVAGLLADQTEFAVPPPDDTRSEGCAPWQEDLLVVCWTRHGEERAVENFGPYLLEMSDAELQAAYDANGGLRDEFLESIEERVRAEQEAEAERRAEQERRLATDRAAGFPERLRLLDQPLTRHEDALAVVRDMTPDEARSVLQRALARNEQAARGAVFVCGLVVAGQPLSGGGGMARAITGNVLRRLRQGVRAEDARANLQEAATSPSDAVRAAAARHLAAAPAEPD